MKKLTIALFIAIAAIVTLFSCSAAMAETISVTASETRISILSKNDCIIGIYFDANVEIDRDDASKLNGDVYVKSAPANGNLGTNRYQRNPRFANGSMNQFAFSGTWVEEQAYIAFNGDAQALIEATLVSSREGYSSHRLWNRHARPVAVPVFEGNIGGRSIRVSFIEKENIRYYGLELLEQTVNTVVHQQPIVTPTIEEQEPELPEQPQPPVVEPTIEEEPVELPQQPEPQQPEPQEPEQPQPPVVEPTIEEEPVTVQETTSGEGYTTGTVGGRRR